VMQMEAHHYWTANLIGVEYIVSERLFATLPDDEQELWHPHNYEVLSGELVAPGLPEVAERAFLARLMNSYGKTWRTWHTGRHDQGPGDALPLGEPMLMWSFNRDGEADAQLKRDRNEALRIDVEQKRARRQDLPRAAHPQRGVDPLSDAFPETRPVRRVTDVRSRPEGRARDGRDDRTVGERRDGRG